MPRRSSPDVALTSGTEGRELVARQLREEISAGTLPPGYRLIEADLSDRFAVSRNSARLALDVLITEALVERVPNKSARVRLVPLDEAVEIMETRMVLDGLMARKAAEHGTDDELASLGATLRSMEEAVGAGEFPRYTDLIQSHHSQVHAAARQPIIAGLLDRLQAQIGRHQFRLSLSSARAQRSLAELRRVVEAICARDAEAAEMAAREHFRETVEALRAESAAS